MCKFEEIYSLNVNDKVEKKGNLAYLSWAWAWAEFKKHYPKATYCVDKFDGTYCTGNETIGYMVRTEVFADDLQYEMWLPVMDMRNNTILKPKMTEINKTIMRCLTKNLAMFGLGLYIYAGEDLPEDLDGNGEDDTKVQPIKQTAENKPKKTSKTVEGKKDNKFLTRKEMVETWGVSDVEATIKFYADQLGIAYEDWDEIDAEAVREVLKNQKAKREAAKRKATLERIDGSDLHFSAMGDK